MSLQVDRHIYCIRNISRTFCHFNQIGGGSQSMYINKQYGLGATVCIALSPSAFPRKTVLDRNRRLTALQNLRQMTSQRFLSPVLNSSNSYPATPFVTCYFAFTSFAVSIFKASGTKNVSSCHITNKKKLSRGKNNLTFTLRK